MIMTYVVVIFIILTVSFAYYNYKKQYSPINVIIKELKIINNSIEKEDMPINNIKNLSTINEIINDNSEKVKKDWKKYYTMTSRQAKINSILNPDYYISTEILLEKYTNKKLTEVLPSILTGIGILGTFLGLVIGLWNLDSLEITVLKDQIPVLIGGMKISFLSSLVAIACSLLWTYIEKNMINNLDQDINKFLDETTLLLPIRNESNLLDEIVDNQHKQLNATKEFISDTLIPELVNGLQAAVEKTISPEISKMNTTVDKLAEVSTNKQAESIDKMVDKFMHTFNESFDNQFDALKETLEDVIIWQKNTKNEMEELINTIEKNAQSQNSLLVSTESLLINMQKYVSEFDTLHQELNTNVSSLNDITGQLNNIEGHVNNKLSSMIEEYTRLDKIRNDEKIRLENQFDEITNYWGSIKESFNNLDNNLSNSMNQFTDNMYNGLSRTFEVFDDNLADISNRLGVTIQNINDSVEELPDSINNLINTIGEFESNQETLLEQINTTNKKIDNLKEKDNSSILFSEFKSNQEVLLEQINQANKKIDDLKENENKGLFSRFGGNK